MLVWSIVPFYDFCGFWSLAVNGLYKLQFFHYSCYFICRFKQATLSFCTANVFLRMNTRHQAHKPVKKCNYWGRFCKRNGQRVKLRQRAKFRGDRSNRRRYMAIFLFFQHGGRPPSWICYVCSDHPRRAFGGLYRCARFGWNRCSSFDNMHVFRFHDCVLKTPIQLFTPNIGVFGDFTP